MPTIIKEIAPGYQVSRSSNEGQLSDTATRAFRVVLASPGESFDIQQTCGVRIGDAHPVNGNVFCISFDAKFDGDSRMVLLCTFQYQSTASASSSGGGADPKSQPPDTRPPNWTTSTSLIEQPLYTWRKRTGQVGWGEEQPASNPVGDIYDGVSKIVPVVTISVETWASSDPTTDNLHAGKVNSNPIRVGSLSMSPHTVMFRGVQSQPAVESWGDRTYRGWKTTYEFMYKKNETRIRVGGAYVDVDLGWDIAVPQTGFNVKAFDPPGDQVDDVFGQPLAFGEDATLIDPARLADDIAEGDKVRAMVRVPLKDKSTQAPSASPVPLNDNGRPRSADAEPKVLVYGYAVQPEYDFRRLNGGRPLIQ